MSTAVPDVISTMARASSRRIVSGLASCIAAQGSKRLGLELAIVSLMPHVLDAVKNSLEGERNWISPSQGGSSKNSQSSLSTSTNSGD